MQTRWQNGNGECDSNSTNGPQGPYCCKPCPKRHLFEKCIVSQRHDLRSLMFSRAHDGFDLSTSKSKALCNQSLLPWTSCNLRECMVQSSFMLASDCAVQGRLCCRSSRHQKAKVCPQAALIPQSSVVYIRHFRPNDGRPNSGASLACVKESAFLYEQCPKITAWTPKLNISMDC